MKDEKKQVSDSDNLPYLRVYTSPDRPVCLWKFDSLVQSMFTPGYKRDLPDMWLEGLKKDPGES